MPAGGEGRRTVASATLSPARARAEPRVYRVSAVIDATRLLPPPPANDAARRDLEAVRAAQRTRTPRQAAAAEACSALDVFLFRAVLGPGFTAARMPATAVFLERACTSSLPYLHAAKNCWNRVRPFVVDPSLEPLERSLASTRSRSAPATAPEAAPLPQVDSPGEAPAADVSYAASYPSGHAFIGTLLAILLAELLPERRVELFAFGWEYGDARVVGGVHFPSDVEAGRILATVLVESMMRDPRFRADLDVARRELRSVLGYPLE